MTGRGLGARALQRVLALQPGILDLHTPGFAAAEPELQQSLSAVVNAFGAGYTAALGQDPVWPAILAMPHPLRGFAAEGAAMSTTLSDLLTLSGGRRLRALGTGEGERYIHLIHVGAGWAFAQLHVRPWRAIRYATPLLGWLAWDGWGFQQAYFRASDVFERQRTERAARGVTRPIRDQGAGRSLWFYAGADLGRVATVIAAFAPQRRADLWAGIGLAAAYTGAQPPDVAVRLIGLAGAHRDQVAQGAAFAAKAHELSGSTPRRSADVIEALTGATPEVAASWTDAAYQIAVADADTPTAYDQWRALIRRAWRRHAGGVLL